MKNIMDNGVGAEAIGDRYQISDVVYNLSSLGCRITEQTIRQYEIRNGLITPYRLGPGRYRYYSREMIGRIYDIYFLTEIGFPKCEIKSYLLLKDKVKKKCATDVEAELYKLKSGSIIKKSDAILRSLNDFSKRLTGKGCSI